MAIHTKLAKKVLTKKEQQHLTESKITSMAKLWKQMRFNDESGWVDHCFTGCMDCRQIGMKLGIYTKE